MVSGIYSILNEKNGKLYIGQSVNIRRRFNDHKRELACGIHSNSHLQSAWDKYGESSFSFNVLEHCEFKDLNRNEEWWIDFLDTISRDKGYNLKSGGNSNIKYSEESIAKMSKTQSRLKTWLGRHHTEETKLKISKSKKGKSFTEEHKQNISKNHADQSKKNNPLWGTSVIEEYGGLDFLKEEAKKDTSIVELARRMNIDKSTIQDYLKCRGYLWSGLKGTSEMYTKIASQIIDEFGGFWFLENMASTGCTIKYIASCLDLDESTIRKYLKDNFNTTWTEIKRGVIV